MSATEVEYVNYKDFVADLESTEAPGVDDVTVVSNETDGPRTIPANTSALTNTATDSDLTTDASFELQTATGKKKVPANLLAKASDLGVLVSTIDLNDSSLWTNSQIDSTNGSVSASDSRLSTPDSLALAPNTIFDYTKGANITSLSIYVYAYEDDGTFISGLISVENFPTWIQSHPEAKLFKLSMIPTGSVAVIPSNLDDIVTFNADVYVYNVASKEYVDNLCDSLQEAIVQN